MINEDKVLCASNAYIKKFYVNQKFSNLPSKIKEELKKISVEFTSKESGIFLMEFADDGELSIKVIHDESDKNIKDVEEEKLIEKIKKENLDLFSRLKLYYLAINNIDLSALEGKI